MHTPALVKKEGRPAKGLFGVLGGREEVKPSLEVLRRGFSLMQKGGRSHQFGERKEKG